jgi:hypothetical protein
VLGRRLDAEDQFSCIQGESPFLPAPERGDATHRGGGSFTQSLVHLLAQRDIVAQINFLPAMSATNLTRKELANATQLAVSSGWHAMVNNEFHLAQQ